MFCDEMTVISQIKNDFSIHTVYRLNKKLAENEVVIFYYSIMHHNNSTNII